MYTLRSFFLFLACFLLVLFQPSYSYGEEVYEITESELNQLEMNLRKSLETLEKSEEKLLTLEEQLKTQSESLRKSEQERNLIVKIGVPVVIVAIVGAFVGGVATGVRVPP